MTLEETKQALRLVFSAYPTQRAKLSADDMRALLEVWSLALADCPIDMIKSAIARHICTSQWMPSIFEIRQQLGMLHHGLRRSGVDAWGDLKALRTYRDRSAMEQVDPVTLHVCERFDWIEWRTLFRGGEDIEQWHVVTGEHEASDRARFAELYDKTTADERTVAQLSAGGKAPQRQLGDRGGARALGDLVQGLLPEKVST